jgi:hypothetical protein
MINIKIHQKKRIRLLNELEDLEDKRKLKWEQNEEEDSGENHIEDSLLQVRELERNIDDIVTCLYERL